MADRRVRDKKQGQSVYIRTPAPVFYFIGNFDFSRKQKKRVFTKLELGKHVHGNDNKTMVRLEDIKTFFTKQIVKRIVFI